MQYRTEKGIMAAGLITAIFISSWYIAYFAHSYLPKGRTTLDANPGGIKKLHNYKSITNENSEIV